MSVDEQERGEPFQVQVVGHAVLGGVVADVRKQGFDGVVGSPDAHCTLGAFALLGGALVPAELGGTEVGGFVVHYTFRGGKTFPAVWNQRFSFSHSSKFIGAPS